MSERRQPPSAVGSAPVAPPTAASAAQSQRLIDTVRASMIGAAHVIEGPYGWRRVTYADFAASGRSLGFIEDFLRTEVMPLYANTHTEASGTGLQTTRFRDDARDIIRRALGATHDDCVIFVGSGATSAINKIVDVLNLRIGAELDARYGFSKSIPAHERPVVFIGPYEHHSNELPWRESIADVVTIDEDADGRIDLAQLEMQLRAHQARPLKIGSFSAASNVTGIASDTHAVAALLHRYGALSFWDYAAAGPYVDIDMNPRVDGAIDPSIAKDAVFISPHKFIGGPGTPGILIAKRALFKNRVPTQPGGGTVSYVNPTEHRYLDDPEHREEAGTPAILESIRAGLVFQLKQAVGVDTILAREESFIRRAIDTWSDNPNIHILGNKEAWRLSIVSFVIAHQESALHHNYIVALLNDLFGIQARGGCSCAGPYGHRLLGIDVATSHEFEEAILAGATGVKPGWVRINFNYFYSEAEVDFLIRAVDFVARHGWELLPHYRFDMATGLWAHVDSRPQSVMRLDDISYAAGKLDYTSKRHTDALTPLSRYIEEAEEIVARAIAEFRTRAVDDARPVVTDAASERLRWFPLPAEALCDVQGRTPASKCGFQLWHKPRAT